MNALKGMIFVPLAIVFMGACYVSSMIIGWLFAILTTVGIVIVIVAVILHGLYTYITQSGKKPPRKQ
tara:strand:+ start:2675 stop:2875 length:201 start_codon:yes stop_codon:yes gene_type:complete